MRLDTRDRIRARKERIASGDGSPFAYLAQRSAAIFACTVLMTVLSTAHPRRAAWSVLSTKRRYSSADNSVLRPALLPSGSSNFLARPSLSFRTPFLFAWLWCETRLCLGMLCVRFHLFILTKEARRGEHPPLFFSRFFSCV